jgi:adenylate cyclase
MLEGLDLLRQSGLLLGRSLLLSILGGAYLRLDRFDEGLAAADQGLTHSRDTGERCFDAMLWRLRGELILRRGATQSRPRGAAPAAAECFEKAREVARAQGAHMLAPRDGRDRVTPAPRTSGRPRGALSSPGS